MRLQFIYLFKRKHVLRRIDSTLYRINTCPLPTAEFIMSVLDEVLLLEVSCSTVMPDPDLAELKSGRFKQLIVTTFAFTGRA